MPAYIVDANLPFKVQRWSNKNFVHVVKINSWWKDEEIWNYAKQNHLTIITKDKDFSVKQIKEGSPPKLVHIKFGNLKFADFVNRIEAVWEEVESLLQNNSVINIYLNKIEAIK